MCGICPIVEVTVFGIILYRDGLPFKFLQIMGEDTWKKGNGDTARGAYLSNKKIQNLEHLGEL